MTTQIVTAIQQKGGTGKTTLLCMLASLMAEDGGRVVIIDTDPQESAADFAKASAIAGIDIDYVPVLDEDLIVKTAKQLSKDGSHDIIFIDTAGISSRTTDYAIHLADLVLVPVKPARPDVKGLLKSIKAVERVGAIHDSVIPTYMLFSDVDNNTRITSAWLDELNALDTPMLKNQLYHRTGFREFMSNGGRLSGAARRVARSILAEMQMRELLDFYNASVSIEAAE